MDIKILKASTLIEGWEVLNEYLFLEDEEIMSREGGLYSTQMMSYNMYLTMDRGWVDPEFNFGHVLGYSKMKWAGLIKNYVDMKYLDLLRSEISSRVSKKSDSYNYSFHFSNHHGHGKDCLISLLFSKRINQSHPTIIFSIRTSEVTKRLIWDLLMVQRIGEYVYGNNNFEVHLFAPSCFITVEGFLMYNNHKKIAKLYMDRYKDSEHKMNKFQRLVKETYKVYMEHPDPSKIKYRVHRRSCMQLQRGEDGKPRSGVKDLFAKNLQLNGFPLELPKEVLTANQIKNHLKNAI